MQTTENTTAKTITATVKGGFENSATVEIAPVWFQPEQRAAADRKTEADRLVPPFIDCVVVRFSDGGNLFASYRGLWWEIVPTDGGYLAGDSMMRCDILSDWLDAFQRGYEAETAKVGDGATIYIGSDSYPATIVSRTEKTITVQRDDFRAAPGSDYYGRQVWETTRNPSGSKTTFRLVRDNRLAAGGYRLRVGERVVRMDPSF